MLLAMPKASLASTELQIQNYTGFIKHTWSAPGSLGWFRSFGGLYISYIVLHIQSPVPQILLQDPCHNFPLSVPCQGSAWLCLFHICVLQRLSVSAALALSSCLTAMNWASQVKELKNRSWESGSALMRDVVNNHKAIPLISSFNSLLCNYIFQ